MHWSALQELLPVYRAITTVQLGDGRIKSFWFDVWHGEWQKDDQTVAGAGYTGCV
jgi:hypothetical protein